MLSRIAKLGNVLLTCYGDRAAFGQVHIRPDLLAACGSYPPPPIRRVREGACPHIRRYRGGVLWDGGG